MTAAFALETFGYGGVERALVQILDPVADVVAMEGPGLLVGEVEEVVPGALVGAAGVWRGELGEPLVEGAVPLEHVVAGDEVQQLVLVLDDENLLGADPGGAWT